MKYLNLTAFIFPLIIVSCGETEEKVDEDPNTIEEVVEENVLEEPIAFVEDCREEPCNEIDNSSMLAGDVLVRRESGDFGEGYIMTYFHDYSVSIESHGGIYISDEDFDQATYEWIDDTTIVFNLQNSQTNEAHEMQLFGNGNSNGVIVPDEEGDVTESE